MRAQCNTVEERGTPPSLPPGNQVFLSPGHMSQGLLLATKGQASGLAFPLAGEVVANALLSCQGHSVSESTCASPVPHECRAGARKPGWPQPCCSEMQPRRMLCSSVLIPAASFPLDEAIEESPGMSPFLLAELRELSAFTEQASLG